MTPLRPWIIQHYESLATTMDRAELLARHGAPERTLVIANEQTAGRGRSGRTWQGEPGAALQLTAILRPRIPPRHLPVLPLLVGVAVATAIEAASGAEARLKWPNDVWLGDDPERQKVAGILMTSRLSAAGIEFVLVGIGVNVSTTLLHLPPGATSLREATGWTGHPGELLDALLPALDRVYDDFVQTEGRPSLAEWRRRAALLGELVSIEEHGARLTGMLAGISDDGALLLETAEDELHRVISGDVVRGPRRVIISST